MNNYFSRDPHFVILAWVQSWNISEKLMKVWSLLELFHKNMSHEQLLFMWSTFRDSSMGTKLKYFWKTHESVKSAWIFSQKHVSRTITFHVITFRDSSMGTKLKYFEKLMKVWSPPEFFHKNMSHKQLLFMWSTFRDSSMGTNLKYFWKTHESVKSAWIFEKWNRGACLQTPFGHWPSSCTDVFLDSCCSGTWETVSLRFC